MASKSNDPRDFSSLGFAKTFVLPGLLVFLVPIISLFFFLHAQSRFDSEARASALAEIRADTTLSAEDREQAIAMFTQESFSNLVQIPEFAAEIEQTTLFYYATFRWMIRLSLCSIILGVAVFALTGACVLLSLRSLQAQYLSLSVGWQVLRIYGAVQTILQGILLVALSFWVTALWFNSYSVKLVLMAGALAVIGAVVVIAGIFKRPKTDCALVGRVLDGDSAKPMWEELKTICRKVGTEPPSQVIAGIDDNFFVTETPVTIDGKTFDGRTLFVSLSLLKQMSGSEADAVLAHEMAHFSGNDTLFSKKISPLLARYGAYLDALYSGGITRPIFYFMHCFRAMFELSLGRLSRQREFRADRIAAETTSPRDMAQALLRIAAYSNFRDKVQRELFEKEQALEAANVSERIEQGFHAYAATFASNPDIGKLTTSHPFDTHPPLDQRLDAVGVPLESKDVRALLATPGNGRWYHKIGDAEQIERQQWSEFEQQFRQYHEESLAYRFLPESEEELSIVVKAFPEIVIEGNGGSLQLSHDALAYTQWPGPVRYQEITECAMDDSGKLHIHYKRDGKQKQSINVKSFATRQQDVLDAINRYYSRYLNAVAYQEQKRQLATAGVG
jgi:Zn-dependent protease with chaperone function